MNRREFLALAGLTGMALSGCTKAAPRPSAAPSVLGLTYIPNIQFSPAYAAIEQNLFPLPVTLRHHGQQEGLFQALMSGQEQFVVAGGDEAMVARSQGQPLVVIASYYERYPVEIITMAASGITSVPQLKGKRIGVPGRYGSSWYGLLVALKAAKLTEKDVQIVEIGYTSQAALSGNKVDAVVGFANNDAVQMKLARLDIIEIPLATHVPLVGACLLTTQDVYDSQTAQARSVASGFVAGCTRVSKDRSMALSVTDKYLPQKFTDETRTAADATLGATIGLMTSNGAINTGLWKDMAGFLHGEGLLKAEVNAEDMIRPAI